LGHPKAFSYPGLIFAKAAICDQIFFGQRATKIVWDINIYGCHSKPLDGKSKSMKQRVNWVFSKKCQEIQVCVRRHHFLILSFSPGSCFSSLSSVSLFFLPVHFTCPLPSQSLIIKIYKSIDQEASHGRKKR
jgi:hypothetical protein